MTRLRATAALVVLCLVTVACGARLDQQTLEHARAGALEIASGTEQGTGGGTGEGGTTGSGAAATVGGTDDAATSGEAVTTTAGTTTGGSTGGTTDGTAGGAAGDATTGDATGGTADGGTTGGGARDTRAAPPGGNGGATAPGVTEDLVVVSNVSDLSGPVPGLFEDAALATRARFEKFAAEEGTVYGRRIELRIRDARMDSGANRQQYQAACDDSFMAVGSMSAFDAGIQAAVEGCGIPDLRTAGVSRPAMQTEHSYSVDAMSDNLQPLSEYLYWKEVLGAEGVRRACYLKIAAETTAFQTALVREGTEQIGYEWVYDQTIEVSESNYAPYVLEMKDRDCRFVTFQGAYQQAVKLAKAMRQQNYWPGVYALQSNSYTPDYIRTGGADVEGTHIAVPSVILEEIGQHPELQEYARWLERVAPGERPTGLGMYAWSAASLTIDLLKEVGPELTRERFEAAVKQVRAYDGNGLIPPQNIGEQYNADCVIIVQVRDGAFHRIEPSQGMRCDDRVVTVEV